MTGLEYGLFDCDTHCYETRDSFTRYLPKKWRQYAIAPVRLHDGTERILAGRPDRGLQLRAGPRL